MNDSDMPADEDAGEIKKHVPLGNAPNDNMIMSGYNHGPSNFLFVNKKQMKHNRMDTM